MIPPQGSGATWTKQGFFLTKMYSIEHSKKPPQKKTYHEDEVPNAK